MVDDLPAPEHAEVSGAEVDSQVPWRVFVAVGVVVGLLFVVYGATSKEEAGSAMLGVATLLALWCGAFLWRNAKRLERDAEADAVAGAEAVGAEAAHAYLPEASPWPFGIGLGAALAFNGLLIGIWFLIPGVMLLAVSIAGFARQSRHRF